MTSMILTLQASVVRFYMGFLDSAVFSNQCISLGAVATEDCSAVEGEIEGLGELEVWIGEEADLASC